MLGQRTIFYRRSEIQYLSELLDLLLPLCAILVFFDCAEEEVDLSDDNSGERVGPRGAARTRTCACTEGAMMGTVDWMTDPGHDGLLRG
jgi:hypothetical protein